MCSSMAPPSFLLFLCLYFTSFSLVEPKTIPNSPYLSNPETVFFPDHNKMVNNFRIYIYNPPKTFNFTTPSESSFYDSLMKSKFLTKEADEAHLFFVPFPADLSSRSISRHIKGIRGEFPYWDRTLGADHFYLSTAGINFASDRNALELKKNAVQISCFPAASGSFVPHKDLTLPPLNPTGSLPPRPTNGSEKSILGFMKDLVIEELDSDADFVVGSDPSELETDLGRSKFCLFDYGGDVSWIGEALGFGCVPVVIIDRPIQDLPLMDVLRWSEMAVFVGKGSGARALKAALTGIDEDRYEKMKSLGETAAQHFQWNASPQPLDAFHMVMYQLWLRRHTIRYTRRESK